MAPLDEQIAQTENGYPNKSATKRCMSAIRSRNTGPELIVRRLLRKLGIRFRTNMKLLPGKPDVVLPKLNTIILVNGCYWHRHNCPKGRSLPVSNSDFWTKKLERNRERDRLNSAALKRLGWHVSVVWQCETRDEARLESKLRLLLRRA